MHLVCDKNFIFWRQKKHGKLVLGFLPNLKFQNSPGFNFTVSGVGEIPVNLKSVNLPNLSNCFQNVVPPTHCNKGPGNFVSPVKYHGKHDIQITDLRSSDLQPIACEFYNVVLKKHGHSFEKRQQHPILSLPRIDLVWVAHLSSVQSTPSSDKSVSHITLASVRSFSSSLYHLIQNLQLVCTTTHSLPQHTHYFIQVCQPCDSFYCFACF